ncbi:ethylbenzene dehydrogenase-related protein [Candidatus Nitronereus thalassa]|uniref:Ethylbenzene dehydrogenase-related protein n=1 Tax=Candidatus Nitronereus thalassa TaxID=3020898 RepID=A0ABU3KAY1_9BACT|nr:ethylbenzene dehydrogenase-related protein [Candidatus Nitronereus thalassa]MDT7043564.1 ethylbenzene dehydrogenase-related protein [Candidatus Nitronereus thalassa]
MGREKVLGVALGAILMTTGLSASLSIASEPPPEGDTGSVAVRLYLTEGALPTNDPNAASWNTIQPSEFKLAPQVHWPDRIQEVTVKSVKVRGMHNGQDLAIMVEYEDPSESPADAAALEFMVGDKMSHFAHGQEMLQVEGGPVNIWYWKNSDGKGTDMSAKGFKTLRVQDQQDVSAMGTWQGGTWRVVFSRPLATGDEHDVQITPGEWRNIAFAFWDGELVDGEAREKGSQKAVSSWWSVRAEPSPDNSLYGYVVLGIAIAAGFEFFLIRKIRRGNQA